MFDNLRKILLDLIDKQQLKCNQLIKTDSNCNPASDTRLLHRYKNAYDEFLKLESFYEKFSNEEDDQFE